MYINLKPAIMTIEQALGTFIPWLPGTNTRPFSESSSASFIITWCQISSNLLKDIHVIRLNLRPGKRSLVAKVEDEAGVHDVLTLDPKNRFSYERQFFCIRQNPKSNYYLMDWFLVNFGNILWNCKAWNPEQRYFWG